MRLVLLVALGALGVPAQAQEGGQPLSAIDWLSQSLESTATAPPPQEPPVTDSASAPGITVTPLDSGVGGAVGVLPPEVTGLPLDLWAKSDPASLVSLIREEQAEAVPALQDLLITLMLAEAVPPQGSDGEALFLARVDKLLDLGALDAAQSLLESGDLLEPEAFRRWFDVTLLRGTESDACAVLRSHPSLAPTLMARVFCTARNGDWNAAALMLNTAHALGDVTPEEEVLLTRFLDPEFAEPGEELPSLRPSPLVYRMQEAVGDLMPTTGLPLAFSYADLRDTVAWRNRIEAVERLARHGAISENVLLDLYTAKRPAASGGVWDRAAAIQRLDATIRSGDKAEAAEALPPAWAAMQEVGLEVPFARLFGEKLLGMELEGSAGEIARRVALLSPAYEAAARSREPASPEERVLNAVATGEVEGVEGTDAPSDAVLAGLRADGAPEPFATELREGRVGEAVLGAIAAFQGGIDGDYQAVSDAIATLRAAGLGDAARRASLQFLLLDAKA